MTRTNIVVTASAGTGKTYRLVSEFTAAILGSDGEEPIHPRRILALTFTEKAAAEMKTRISSRLAEIEIPKGQKIRNCVRELDQAPITTYHSFCAKILREYAAHLDIDPRFQLLDSFEEEELATKVGRQVVMTKIEEGDVATLSLIARLDISGVVEQLVSMRARMIESGIEPPQLPLSKSMPVQDLLRSVELKEALERCHAAFEAYRDVTLSATALERVEHARGAIAQLKAVFYEVDEALLEIQISSLFSTLKSHLGGRFGPDSLRQSLISEVTSLGALLCASFVSPEENAFKALLTEFWTQIEITKRRTMSLAFGDLLLLTRRLLLNNLEIRKELKARFDRVLVDEYQDTSPIQEDIVALLCETSAKEQKVEPGEASLAKVSLAQGKLFVVGDPKQSIYGFRGSDVALFKRMADVIVGQGGTQESLNVSRRSSPGVVQIVNLAVPCEENEKLIPLRESTGPAGALLKSPDEPFAVVSEVQGLLAEHLEPKDIAILVRRIKKATPILQALLKAGVPAKIWGGDGFFERQEIVELVSLLKLVVNPSDSIALLTVMRSPLVEFEDFYWPSLFTFTQESQRGFTVASLREATSQNLFNAVLSERLRAFFETFEWVQSRKGALSAVEALEKVLSLNAYRSTLASEAEANVQKLRGLLIDIEGDFNTQVDAIVQKVNHRAKEALGEERLQPNCVRLMTIHQSKGLEFPVVILADTSATIPSDASDMVFDDKLGVALTHRGRPIAVCAPEGEWAQRFGTPIQAARARQRQKSEAELSRLLYVALTRARDRIYVVDSREVDEAGKSNHRGTTLLSLFLAGASDALAVKVPAHVDAVASRELSQRAGAPSTIDLAAAGKMITPPPRKLAFASDLFMQVQRSEIRAERLLYQSGHSLQTEMSASERGSLAHKLIRMATEQMTVSEFEDEDTVRRVLDASLRMLGAKRDDLLIADCVATLEEVIWPLLKSEFEISFEVPMLYENDEWVVKGFADAVARRGEIACIIDFKSSTQAAQSDRTKLQLLAYCSALKESALRIFYASCVIGAREPVNFEAFDESSEQLLRDHLAPRLPYEAQSVSATF